MSPSKKVSYLFFILLISVSSQIYSQISVKLQQPPPFQFKIEQFWKAIITNNGGAVRGPISVFLRGTATETLQGKIIEATSSVITLQPGVKIISGRELGPFTIRETNSRFTDIRLKTGSLPAGNYEICITVFDAKSGVQLASDCIETTVENFNRMELISPLDGEVIGNLSEEKEENLKLKTIKGVPAIIFSWLPPVPVPPGARISYRLKLVEILGYQSIYSAMTSNPLYFQSLKLSSTMLRYPVAAKRLEPGKNYAWSIEAFVDDFKIQESEIRSFEIKGNDKKKIRYDVSSGGTTQYKYNEAFNNNKSELPSGLSLYTNKSFGPSNLDLFDFLPQVAQPDSPSIFKFFGDGKFTFTTSGKPAQFSQLPLNYWTLEFNPRVSLFDIPFGLNIYLSSLNSSNRQSVNSISFVLDIDQLKSKIKSRVSEKVNDVISSVDSSLGKLDIETLSNPDNFSESAKILGLISPLENFFMDIKTLEIGRAYPDYSELTASGIPVNGFNVEYNPGIFYIAASAGTNADAI